MPRRSVLSRREILGGSAATLALAACDPSKPTPGTGDDTGAGEPIETSPIPPVTANEDFYITTYSRDVPDDDWAAAWSLTIAVEGVPQATLDYATLTAMDSEEVEHTLECIGNASSRSISNAKWTGIRLSALLDALHVTPTGDWIHITCGDDYHTCIPRSDLDGRLMLVWLMNGEPLPAEHGRPLRMLTPGRYGMKNPKWITGIDFVSEHVDGTWESVGWSDEAPYQLHSWIHSPGWNETVAKGGPVVVYGSAYAGEIAIAKVEISDDDGATWNECEITYSGPYHCWTLWKFDWTPPDTDRVTLTVRATDVTGRVQEATEQYDADLDGFEGLQTVTVYLA
jgi:DMSO/TMAO reductase YedYZ molybdopterin-dependent catalytic subunit